MALPVKLQADEEVVTIRKRHPVYVILKGILAVDHCRAGDLAAVVDVRPVRKRLVVWTWLYVAAVVVPLLYIGLLFYRWQNDLWIVTNQRLIDALRTTPLNQSLSSTDLINVQDISVQKRGMMATMFNFGDVECQTASTQGMFSFRRRGPSRRADGTAGSAARRGAQSSSQQAWARRSAQASNPPRCQLADRRHRAAWSSWRLWLDGMT